MACHQVLSRYLECDIATGQHLLAGVMALIFISAFRYKLLDFRKNLGTIVWMYMVYHWNWKRTKIESLYQLVHWRRHLKYLPQCNRLSLTRSCWIWPITSLWKHFTDAMIYNGLYIIKHVLFSLNFNFILLLPFAVASTSCGRFLHVFIFFVGCARS